MALVTIVLEAGERRAVGEVVKAGPGRHDYGRVVRVEAFRRGRLGVRRRRDGLALVRGPDVQAVGVELLTPIEAAVYRAERGLNGPTLLQFIRGY